MKCIGTTKDPGSCLFSKCRDPSLRPGRAGTSLRMTGLGWFEGDPRKKWLGDGGLKVATDPAGR